MKVSSPVRSGGKEHPNGNADVGVSYLSLRRTEREQGESWNISKVPVPTLLLNDQSLSQAQIVDYIVQNGYVENMAELMKPPFDKPVSFMKLFDKTKQQRIMELVTGVRENAIRVMG